MPQRSRTWLATLGLLTCGSRTGYDLRHLIENSLRFFWDESYGQIYPTLRALADDLCAAWRLFPIGLAIRVITVLLYANASVQRASSRPQERTAALS